jgi:putative ABC transport system substrate-binding protein
MKRRNFLTLSGIVVLAARSAAAARGVGQPARIGFLGNSTATLEANLVGPFREGLRDLGYVEGDNLIIEYRWAEGDYARFPALIAELVALNVEVIATAGTPATLALKKATSSIPIVMIAVGDPVGSGIVQSLSRPGGNITGLTSIAPELEGKRLELLKEVVPQISLVAVLWNPSNRYMIATEQRVQAAARVLGLRVLSLAVQDLDELENAFATIRKERPEAFNVLADRLFLHNRVRIMEFAAEQRLPGVHAYRELVEAGGLMSFGPSYAGMHRQAATYVDRILKGANPADLPIEQPAEFELVVNLRTAQALGIEIPPSILLRADEVIE